MKAKLEVFEDLEATALEKYVDEFMEEKVSDVIKIYFKQNVQNNEGKYLNDITHTCYLLYVPKLTEQEKVELYKKI